MCSRAGYADFTRVPRRHPQDRESIPHRDYWLAPERREATWQLMGDWLAWFGVATIVLMVAVTQFVVSANHSTPPVLSPAVRWLVFAYLAYSFVWATMIILRFFRKPAGDTHH